MTKMKLPVCPACGEVMLGESPATIGVIFQLQDGKKVPGSEKFVGIFHPECWKTYKAEHQSA